jgi:hypothetical protein
MLPCPTCKRRVFSRLDIIYAPLQGQVRCRFCGSAAQLDLLSRWVFLSILALSLPGVLLYGNVFYSGHLLVISMSIILIAWCVLSFLCFPLFTLEAVSVTGLNRTQGAMMLAVLLLAAMLLDGFIASRIDAEVAREQAKSTETRRSP